MGSGGGGDGWHRFTRWLVPALTASALAGAGWLFFVDGSDPPPAPPDEPAATTVDSESQADGDRIDDVLVLPDADGSDGTDSGRRDATGSERLDTEGAGSARTDSRGDAAAGGEGAGEEEDDSESDASVLAQLEGASVVLAPASATSPRGASTRLVRIGAPRVECAGARDDDRLVVERALLAAIGDRLQKAGAAVQRIDGDDGTVPCVDQRIAAMDDGDVVVVLRSEPDRADAVFAGRSAAGGSAPPPATSAALASEIATALAVPHRTALTPAQRSLLARTGAIATRSGPSVAFVSIGDIRPGSPTSAADAVADDIVTGIAMAATRADVAEPNSGRVRGAAATTSPRESRFRAVE